MLRRTIILTIVVLTTILLTTIFQPLQFLASLAWQQPQGCQTFPETGKKVCGRFLQHWQQNGGLAQQGFPLSDEFTEVSELNGQTYLVQYFERAVFERHPENKPPYDVLLSQLGTTQFKRKYPFGAPSLILSVTELKYRLFEAYGHDVKFCDRDDWPVARGEEAASMEWYRNVDQKGEEFQTILWKNNLPAGPGFTPEDILLAYREYKRLQQVSLTQDGSRYRFALSTSGGKTDPTNDPDPDPRRPQDETGAGTRFEGYIEANGLISETSRIPINVNCPRCLSPNTLISTPDGPVPVKDLRVGMAVWTAGRGNAPSATTILKVSRVAVGSAHHMVRLKLEDGRELLASPGHPTADGGVLGDLRAGDVLDGSRINSVQHIPYEESYTYDILPAGETGVYWANGILLGSTLKAQP